MKKVEIYRHKGGGFYELIAKANNKEDGKEFIVYKFYNDVENLDVWIRPLDNFHASFRKFTEFKGLKALKYKLFPNQRQQMFMGIQLF